MAIDRSLFWAGACSVDGYEPHFGGYRLVQGNHLRWAFRPDLGFPPGGVTVDRCGAVPCEFSERGLRWTGRWERIAEVRALEPGDASEARRRLVEYADGARLRSTYEPHIPDMLALLAQADAARARSGRARVGGEVRFDVDGLIAAASLDPFVARMMGLLFIDTDATPDVPLAYRVTGDWGDAAWPTHEVDLAAADTREIELGIVRWRHVRMESTRQLVLHRDEGRLEATGTRDLPVTLVLPRPARWVHVRVEDARSVDWVVAAAEGERPVGGLALDVESGGVRVTAEEPFDTVEIRQTARAPRTWRLRGIEWREREGRVGALEAFCIVGPGSRNRSHGACADPPELSSDLGVVSEFLERRPVAPPHSVEAEPVSYAPVVLESGEVPGTSMHVAVSCRLGEGPEDGRRGVRLQVRRGTAETPVVTLPLPFPREDIRFFPFRGKLSGIGGLRSATIGRVAFGSIDAHVPEAMALRLEGEGGVKLRARKSKKPPKEHGLELSARVMPMQHGEQTIAHVPEADLWFGLTGKGLVPTLRIGKQELCAQVGLRVGEWTGVGVSVRGTEVELYVDGKTVASHRGVQHAKPISNTSDVLVGARVARGVDLDLGFRGYLTDVYIGPPIWDRPFNEPLVTDQPIVYREDDPDAPQLVEPWVPNGYWAYQVRAIDLFGRVSAWSDEAVVWVRDRQPPPAPLRTRAAVVPVRATVSDARRDPTRAGHFALTLGGAGLVWPSPGEVVGHGLRVERSGAPPWRRSQSFRVEEASAAGGALRLVVSGPDLPFLRPEPGDAAFVEIDRGVEVSWAWTGRQAFFHPRVREHRVYVDERLQGGIEADVGDVRELGDGTFEVRVRPREPLPGSWAPGDFCDIGGRLYRIDGHSTSGGLRLQVVYLARPVVPPEPGERALVRSADGGAVLERLRDASAWQARVATVEVRPPTTIEWASSVAAPVSASERDAAAASAPWLAHATGPLYRITLPGHALEPLAAEDYVPGAIRAHALGKWVVLDVLHHRVEAEDTVFLVSVAEEEVDGSADLPLTRLRYVSGTRSSVRVPIAPAFPQGTPTYVIRYGVTTVSAHARPVEGAVSRAAQVAVVDRRLPDSPPRPTVRIGPPDYHGVCVAEVRWSAAAGMQYELYRATAAAIFTRDVELRRKRRGAYDGDGGPSSADALLVDDPDFEDWLVARFPELATTWRDRLFVPEPPRDGDRTDWEAATRVWQAWSERHHLALSRAQVAGLAGRRGMAAAFGLATPRPVDGGAHLDRVETSGRVALVYRLGAVSHSLAKSLALGPPSEPVAPPLRRLPAPPAVTDTASTDGRLTVRWAAHPDTNVGSYRVYRSEDPGAVGDVRWAVADPSVHLVGAVDDPRLVVFDRALDLPEGLDLAGVVAVHRADEHDRRRDPGDQPRAFDYVASDTQVHPAGSAHRITQLRPIADGVQVVVVYRTAAGQVRLLDGMRAEPLRMRERDPRVRAVLTHPIGELLGVFDATAFDPTRVPVWDQVTPNLRRRDTAVTPDDSASVLAPLWGFDGPVVLVYRDPGGVVRVVEHQQRWPLDGWIDDEGLRAMRDYYYVVTAVDRAGNASRPSAITRARAVDRRPPPPPTWRTAGWAPSGDRVQLAWAVPDAGTRCLLQRSSAAAARWKPISPWLEGGSRDGDEWVFRFDDDTPAADSESFYRVLVVNSSGNKSVEFDTRAVPPRGTP